MIRATLVIESVAASLKNRRFDFPVTHIDRIGGNQFKRMTAIGTELVRFINIDRAFRANQTHSPFISHTLNLNSTTSPSAMM